MESTIPDDGKEDTAAMPEGLPQAPSVPDVTMIRRVGHGAFGEVWLGRNQTTGQLLAIKLVRRFDPSRGGGGLAAREVAAVTRYTTAALGEHRHLLRIHHVGQTSEALFYLMDPADDFTGARAHDGPDYRPATLAERLAVAAGPLPTEQVISWCRQLLEGLAVLHGAGLSHRDVKPANCVFVGGLLKVADFGLLARSDPAGSIVGTPRYMPRDGRMDVQADVYSVGLILYEMLSGAPAESFPRLPASVLSRRSDPGVRLLNQVMLRASDPDRAARFKDAQAMLMALSDVSSRPGAINRSRRSRARAAAIAGGVALVLALAAWTALRPPAPSVPGSAARVDVNFITHPFEAEIYLDGHRILDDRGEPMRTPCTVQMLEARTYRVVFKKAGIPDLDAGAVDVSNREVEVRWPK